MSLTRIWAGCCALALGLGAAGGARGTVFFTDTFAYPDGQLTDHNGGENVAGGLWVTHSPTPVQSVTTQVIEVVDGAAILKQPAAEDVNRLTNATLATGSTWYYGAKVKVTDLRDPVGTGTFADAYFIHLKDSGTINFRGRGFITAGADPTKFTFGVTSSSSSPTAAAAKWATDLDFGTEYTIVVAYTSDDDDTNAGLVRDGFTDLWVNPATVASTFVTDSNPNTNISSDLTSPMQALALRQSQAAAGPADVAVSAVSVGDSFAEVLAALSGPAPTEDADFDGDGDIDGDDFLTWQQNLGTASGATLATGDADGNGAVNAADLAVWRGQFATAVGAAGAVPEPGSVVLALGLIAGLGACRRRA